MLLMGTYQNIRNAMPWVQNFQPPEDSYLKLIQEYIIDRRTIQTPWVGIKANSHIRRATETDCPAEYNRLLVSMVQTSNSMGFRMEPHPFEVNRSRVKLHALALLYAPCYYNMICSLWVYTRPATEGRDGKETMLLSIPWKIQVQSE